jgi:carboxylesterase type B
MPQVGMIEGSREAIVETASGKLRGLSTNGIHSFKGMPYAGPMSGAR